MIASRRWLIWAAPLVITAALALALANIPLEITARPLCAAAAFGGLMLLIDQPSQVDDGWPYVARLGASLVLGSLLIGAFILLFLIAFYPKPGVSNLLWMLGVPALVALGQARRNLILLVPFVVFGWLAFVFLGGVLQVPVD